MNFDNKTISKVLAAIFLSLVLISILATWYKTMVLRDFVIIDDVDETITETDL